MPPFQTETMSGKPVSTAALEYQAAILTFVTTDCEACERALLAAQAAFDENEEVRVIGIFQREGSEKARALAAKLKLGYPLTVDLDGTISRQYRVTKVPRTFVVDAHGLVRWIGGTEMNEAELKAALQSVPLRR
jgi:peroxiredoxin